MEIETEITITVKVVGKYTPKQLGVSYTENGDGTPDTPSDFIIDKVMLADVDISNSIGTYILDNLTNECLEKIENK